MGHLRRRLAHARQRHPRMVPALVIAFALFALVTMGGGALVPEQPAPRPPGRGRAIRKIGDDGPGDDRFRRVESHGLHHLQGAAHRRAALRDLAEPDRTRCSTSKISASTSIAASTWSASDRRRSPNVRRGRAAQGGSTITQQLARQSFLRPDKTLRRKLQELILAGADRAPVLEGSKSSKLYLNKVYFGDGVLRRGSRVARLFRQARVGAESSPKRRCSRAREIAVELCADGQHGPRDVAPESSCCRRCSRPGTSIAPTCRWRAQVRASTLQRHARRAGSRTASTSRSRCAASWSTALAGRLVYQGGLRVYTTLDMPMQIAAEAAVAEHLKSLDSQRQAVAVRRAKAAARRRRDRRRLPSRTDVGSRPAAGCARRDGPAHRRRCARWSAAATSASAHFNRAVQAKRQPGSAFKPFVYAAALEAGFTPATHHRSSERSDRRRRSVVDARDDHSTGDVDDDADGAAARRAIAPRSACSSKSASAARVQEARDMGVGDLPSVPSLALGSGEVTLAVDHRGVRRVRESWRRAQAGADPPRRGSGRRAAVSVASNRSTRAISDTTAFLMSTMLADVINAGTATKARAIGLQAAGGGQDRHDQRFQRRLVRRLSRRSSSPACGSASISRARSCRAASPPTSRCRLWASVHESRDRERASPSGSLPPTGVVDAKVCRHLGPARRRQAASSVDVRERPGVYDRAAIDGLHRARLRTRGAVGRLR